MQMHAKWQQGINAFLSKNSGRPIALFGTAYVDIDTPQLQIPATYKYCLDVSAETSLAQRIQRGQQTGEPENMSATDQQSAIQSTNEYPKIHQRDGFKFIKPNQVGAELKRIFSNSN